MGEPQLIFVNHHSDSDWNFQQHNYYYEDASQTQDDDPYVYSDDSASLSDAYFRQTDSPSPSPHFPLAQIQAPAFTPYHHNNNNNYSFFDKTTQQQQFSLFGTTNRTCFWRTGSPNLLSTENDPLVGNGELTVATSYGSDRSVASSATTESSLAQGYPGFRKHEIYGSILEDVPEIIEEKEDLTALYQHHHDHHYSSSSHPPPRPRSPSPTLLMAASGFRKYPSTDRQVPPRLTLSQQRRLQMLELKQREQLARELAVSKIRGQSQETSSSTCSISSFHDVWCAALFLLHLAIIVGCAIYYGSSQMPKQNIISTQSPLSPVGDDRFLAAYQSLTANSFLSLVTMTGCFAGILSYLSFGFMLIVARAVIQIILFVSIALALVWSVLGWTVQQQQGNIDTISFLILLPGCCASALSLGYTLMVWNRIDLAATNLYTALCAMRCTADIALLGLVSLFVSLGWCIIWCMAALGVHQAFAKCSEEADCSIPFNRRYLILLNLCLAFSFYWTVLVIKNVVRVVVAGAVGAWWFNPKTVGPCCTNAMRKPLLRSLTKSFGSICLGSLVVFPAQAIAAVISCWGRLSEEQQSTNSSVPATENTDLDSASLLANKTLPTESKSNPSQRNMTERLHLWLRCCNRWAYTYIGMYGYSFATGGEKAIQLFETREWLEVVNENLARNVLLMASLVIGGSTGCFAVLVEEVNGVDFSALDQPIAAAFAIGTVLGFCLANVLLLGVVGSAVNTVLVCFAAGPFEFDKNHPRLSREMREVWSQQVWEPPV